VLATADYATPEAAIRAYLEEVEQEPGDVDAVCLAVAGPVRGDLFRFTNNHWQIRRSAFCRELGLRQLMLINDFSAMALGMTRISDDERVQVVAGEADPGRPCVVMGPGTGLGVGTLLPLPGGRWTALPGEGGHVDLPIGNEREADIWRYLQAELGHVSAEHILSGNGLLRLYRACCALDGRRPTLATPSAVTDAALAGDASACAVIEQFCCFLGRAAGNNVLTLGARGGVYLAGGVIPHFAQLFLDSGFVRCFREKGQMSDYFTGVPVWLVTAEYAGLNGAGVALQQD
jgi:glucokinase